MFAICVGAAVGGWMPVTPSVDSSSAIVVFESSEEVVREDVLAAMAVARDTPACDACRDFIWDESGGLYRDFTSDDLWAVAGSDEFRWMSDQFSRGALVAPSDVQFGMSLAFESWAKKSPIALRTFRTREEALAWLRRESELRAQA